MRAFTEEPRYFAILMASEGEVAPEQLLAAHIRAGCLALTDPDPITIFDHVYAGGSSLLDEEREHLASYMASFEEPHSQEMAH